jgi:hypothetical protein
VEGYDTLHPQKAIFIKESPLEFLSDFLSIVIQTNRKLFRNGMKGKNLILNIFKMNYDVNLIYFSSIPRDLDPNESQTLHGSNHRLCCGKIINLIHSQSNPIIGILFHFKYQNPQGFIMRRWPSRNPRNGIYLLLSPIIF